MLSIFPELFTYSLVAPAILRIALGIIFLHIAYLKFFPERKARISFFSGLGFPAPRMWWALIAGIEFVGALLLLVGLFVQPAAIALALIIGIAGIIKLVRPAALRNDFSYYALLCITLISLLFLGPGFWAIDIPV